LLGNYPRSQQGQGRRQGLTRTHQGTHPLWFTHGTTSRGPRTSV